MIAHPQWPALSTTTFARIVTNPERKILTGQFHLSNHQKKLNCLSWGSKQEGQNEMVYTSLPSQEYPYLPLQPGGGPVNKASPANLHITSPFLPQHSTGQPPATLEVHKMKFKVNNKNS